MVQRGTLTLTMLDTGSTCSVLLSDVAEKLGLDDPLESVFLNRIQKKHELRTKRVNIEVSPINDFGTQSDVSRLIVLNHLNIAEKKVKLQELQEKWPHLSDLKLTEVAGSQVTSHPSSDVTDLISPWKYGVVRGVPLLVFTLGLGALLLVECQEQESICKNHVVTSDEELNETVKSWWRTENFDCRYNNDTKRSIEDGRRVMKFLNEGTQKVDGHYEAPVV